LNTNSYPTKRLSFRSGLPALLLIFFAFGESAADQLKGNSASPLENLSSPANLQILLLDSSAMNRAEIIRVIPLPKHMRLHPRLIHPDSIRTRMSGGILRLRKGDLIAKRDSAEADRLETYPGFLAYWKKVESSSGYQQWLKQVNRGDNVDEPLIPQALFFDSSMAVIPGYIFLRF
jgi:hypothetical protein